MSLQVWLPLSSDIDVTALKNLGMLNANAQLHSGDPIAPSSFSAGGKVCTTAFNIANNNTPSQTIKIPYSTTLQASNQISICMWIKPVLSSSVSWHNFLGWGGNSRLEYDPNTPAIRYYVEEQALMNAGSNVMTLTSGEWAHIAMVADGTNVKFYKNGIQVSSFSQLRTVTSSFNSPSYMGNWIYFFGVPNRGTMVGLYNDIRVYDHALSVKEIHDLALGLMMHVEFYDNYTGVSPNLWSGSWYPMTQRLIGQYYDLLGSDTGMFGLEEGDTLVYRVKITAPSDRGLIARVQFFNSDSDRYSFLGNTIPAGTTGYSTVTRTITATDRSYYRLDLMVTNANSGSVSSTVSYQVGEVKIERGSHATPWTPSPSSTGDGIKDSSWYSRALTVTNHSPTIVADGPASCGISAKFAADEYVGYSLPTGMTKATWMTWIKVDSTQGPYASVDISQGNPTGNLWISVNTENNALWAYCGGLYNRVRTTMFSPDEWHHIAMTWDSGMSQWYCDGEAIGSQVDFSSKRTEWPSGNRSIGDSYAGSSYSGAPFIGSMADWRLYATVLSADDIKKIVKSPIAVDNASNLTANGYVSELSTDQPAFFRNGVVSTTFFSEIVGRYNNAIRFEPDGTTWVRVVHHADPTTYKFSSTDPFTTGVYKDARRWFAGHLCSRVDRWEFILEQKPDASTGKQTFRWIQGEDPNVTTYSDVAPGNITKYGSSQGYSDSGSNYGGVFKFNENSYFVCHNGSPTNWFGALGCWNAWSGGIPGYNGVAIKDGGYIDLFLRVDNVVYNQSKVTSLYIDKGGMGIFADKLLEK